MSTLGESFAPEADEAVLNDYLQSRFQANDNGTEHSRMLNFVEEYMNRRLMTDKTADEDEVWKEMVEAAVAKGFSREALKLHERRTQIFKFLQTDDGDNDDDDEDMPDFEGDPYDEIAGRAYEQEMLARETAMMNRFVEKLVKKGEPLGFTREEILEMASPAGMLSYHLGLETKMVNEIFAVLAENPKDYQGAIKKFPTVPPGCFQMIYEMFASGGLMQF